MKRIRSCENAVDRCVLVALLLVSTSIYAAAATSKTEHPSAAKQQAAPVTGGVVPYGGGVRQTPFEAWRRSVPNALHYPGAPLPTPAEMRDFTGRVHPQSPFLYPPGKAPFFSGGFLKSLLRGPRGSQGYASISTFKTAQGPAVFRRDIGNGDFEMIVGGDLIDLGSAKNAQIVAVQVVGSRQIVVMQATSDDCPVDYLAIDVSAEPYQNWHLGDCHTPLSIWTNGAELFAQAASQDDPQTWVYSDNRVYGPIARSGLFSSEPAQPAPNSPVALASAAPPSSPNNEPTEITSAAPASATGSAATSETNKSKIHHKTHKKPVPVQPAAPTSDATSTAQTIVKKFDPSVLQSATLVAATDTPFEPSQYSVN